MNREEAIKRVEEFGLHHAIKDMPNSAKTVEAFNMAIEALKAKCPTCKWCSDHQESGTRCPIEKHYTLLKDGFCHLYEPYKAEREVKE